MSDQNISTQTVNEDGDTICAYKDCENAFNIYNDDSQTGNLGNEDIYCWSCYESEMEGASLIWKFESDEEPESVNFSNNFAIGKYGDVPDWFEKLIPKDWAGRCYVRTDGWRGHFETVKDFQNITMLENGWTTPWTDATTGRKELFNDWVNQLVEGKIFPPKPLYIMFEQTSNIFSQSVDVFCSENDDSEINEFMQEFFGEKGLNVSLG